MDRVQRIFTTTTPPSEEVTDAFWGACHGGQPTTAAYLLERGAELNWVGYDNLRPLDAARRSDAGPMIKWLHTQGA